MFDRLRAASPAVLEPGVRHADEQTLIAPSPLGGRGLFARRALAAGEPIHVVRTAHLIGGWPTQEDVLSPRAVGDVARALRGDARETRVHRLAAVHDDSGQRLARAVERRRARALLQDDAPRRPRQGGGLGRGGARGLARGAGSRALVGASAHARRGALARALLQSRPLAIGGAPAAHARRYYLAAVHRHGRILTLAARSTRTCGSPPSAPTRCPRTCEGPTPRAALVAARDVAEGEELLLDYGLELTRTTVRYALLNYGIVASLDAASFRQQSLPRDPEGSLLCAPLWCIDNAPDYAGMTAARHAHKFPERIEMLERLLNTAPWNASTVDDDLGHLIVARHALSSLPPTGSRRRAGRGEAARHGARVQAGLQARCGLGCGRDAS